MYASHLPHHTTSQPPTMDSDHYSTLSGGAAAASDSEEAADLLLPTSSTLSRRNSRLLAVVATCLFLLALVSFLAREGDGVPEVVRAVAATSTPASWMGRGVREGVSDKSSGAERLRLAAGEVHSWTNEELSWQRTAYHFQPEKNWMNDPNGPVYYKGWYHLFYQWNTDSAVWGNITWGHAVSRDLIHWLHLPLAMVRDHWYDANGVFSGSATLLPDGRLVMLYTGSTNDSSQVQNLAYPADPSDPLLLRWVKHEANPVLVHPPGIDRKDFRDPSTAWSAGSNSKEDEEDSSWWRVAVGSKDSEHAGIAFAYRTKDFVKYEILPGVMHRVPGTGMWECIDFYPVSTTAAGGLDTSASGPGVKHVIKVSLDDDKHDYYAIGSYDAETNTWTPDDPENDVGIGLRVDYGKYYASKTFYDQETGRRILWGWVGETDSEKTDLKKGWASVQNIPRTVRFDEKTGSNLLFWPVKEVESLRTRSEEFGNVEIKPGSVVPLDVGKAKTQLDIVAEFEVSKEALEATLEADVGYNCSTSGGSAWRGALGPFGLLILADDSRTEQTAVYFYIAKAVDGSLATYACLDELRSSRANDIVKRVYGSTVPVLDGEKLSFRILVDHSVVETFAQGGRTCITSRVYPTRAIYDSAKIFLFNNATTDKLVTAASVKVWEMSSANIHPFFNSSNTTTTTLR